MKRESQSNYGNILPAENRSSSSLVISVAQCSCSLVSQGLVDSLKEVQARRRERLSGCFMSASIPPKAPAWRGAKKDAYVQEYGRAFGAAALAPADGPGAADSPVMRRRGGFEYRWIDSAQQFSHPACLIVCMPDGRVSRYLYGVRFDPPTVRLSLVEASNGKIGTHRRPLHAHLLSVRWTQGRYALAAINLMKAGGALSVLAVGGMVLLVRAAAGDAERFDPACGIKIMWHSLLADPPSTFWLPVRASTSAADRRLAVSTSSCGSISSFPS